MKATMRWWSSFIRFCTCSTVQLHGKVWHMLMQDLIHITFPKNAACVIHVQLPVKNMDNQQWCVPTSLEVAIIEVPNTLASFAQSPRPPDPGRRVQYTLSNFLLEIGQFRISHNQLLLLCTLCIAQRYMYSMAETTAYIPHKSLGMTVYLSRNVH